MPDVSIRPPVPYHPFQQMTDSPKSCVICGRVVDDDLHDPDKNTTPPVPIDWDRLFAKGGKSDSVAPGLERVVDDPIPQSGPGLAQLTPSAPTDPRLLDPVYNAKIAAEKYESQLSKEEADSIWRAAYDPDLAKRIGVVGGGLRLPQQTENPCPRCGGLLIRTGSCYSCPDCGESTGCG